MSMFVRCSTSQNVSEFPTVDSLREAIFRLTDEGLIISQVASALGMTDGGVRYHLRRRKPEHRWMRDEELEAAGAFVMRERGIMPPVRGVHPAIARIWDEIVKQGLDQGDVASRAGLGRATLRKWFKGGGANIYLVEACLNALSLSTVVGEKRA